jgi:hypothetical protein
MEYVYVNPWWMKKFNWSGVNLLINQVNRIEQEKKETVKKQEKKEALEKFKFILNKVLWTKIEEKSRKELMN